MKNKMKRKEFLCIFKSQFITGSPLVESDYSIYWSAGNLLGSLLFLLYMLGDAQMRKVLKKNGILGSAGIGVKWKCKRCFHLLWKLNIWKCFSFQETWEKQTKATWIRQMLQDCITHHVSAFWHFQETLSLGFLEVNF